MDILACSFIVAGVIYSALLRRKEHLKICATQTVQCRFFELAVAEMEDSRCVKDT